MTFLPSDYKTPKNVGGGGYMKLVDGQNRIRVLSEAITGYIVWTNENKPIRYREYPKAMPANIRPDSKVRHFWAFVVWNYTDKAVQILEVTQASIRDGIHALYTIEEYGEPQGYDIIITRTGKDLETSYSVNALPPKPMAGEITAAYEAKKINLDALYDGGNPFEDAPDVDVQFDQIPAAVKASDFRPKIAE